MRARRVDACQPAIVQALRQAGASVWIVNGTIDLVVGYQGRTYLMDCKTVDGRITKSQRIFQKSWHGDILRFVYGPVHALVVIGAVTEADDGD